MATGWQETHDQGEGSLSNTNHTCTTGFRTGRNGLHIVVDFEIDRAFPVSIHICLAWSRRLVQRRNTEIRSTEFEITTYET